MCKRHDNVCSLTLELLNTATRMGSLVFKNNTRPGKWVLPGDSRQHPKQPKSKSVVQRNHTRIHQTRVQLSSGSSPNIRPEALEVGTSKQVAHVLSPEVEFMVTQHHIFDADCVQHLHHESSAVHNY
ncbi:hypothetical protein ON010_g18825 [Phytophthora cinnamomi]|nr:hypothetical protein ON010_g18825 [Phytophthora cinnamomi]